MAGWLRGFSFDELLGMCQAAYRSFDTPGVAPLVPLLNFLIQIYKYYLLLD